MAYCSLISFVLPDTLNKKRYDDVGVYQGSYDVKKTAYFSSKNIIDELKAYSRHMASIDLPVVIFLDINEKNLFYLERIYFKFQTYEGVLEVVINLKDSVVYKMVERFLLSGKLTQKSAYLYEKYWSNALYCVFLNAELDCDEFIRSTTDV